jgi:probable HAF family extracellular repeat protein
MTARTLRSTCLLLPFVVCFFVVFATFAVAQGTYTQIDFPSSGSTQANGVNADGSVVGVYQEGAGTHGFLLQNGVYTTIDYPGAPNTSALGINDKGQIVGMAGNSGYLYDMNTQSFTPIQYPSATDTLAAAINNAGAIAGYALRSNSRFQGFELVGSHFTPITLPGNAYYNFVEGITAAGTLVGYAAIGNNYSNFLFRQGKFQTITIPGVAQPILLGTNPAGTALVGYGSTPTAIAGFVYQGRVLQTLIFPGSDVTRATGINAKGEVVGYFLDGSEVPHGFLWTPSVGAEASQSK